MRDINSGTHFECSLGLEIGVLPTKGVGDVVRVAVLLVEDADVLTVRVKKGSRDPRYDVVKRGMLSVCVPEEDMTFDETTADSTQPPLELPPNEH